jgi:nitroreductase
MNPIDALLQRRSVSPRKFGDRGPTDDELDLMLRAGARAADHGSLLPWRFVVVRGEARARLGEVFAQARAARDPAARPADLDKERAKPLRAPLMIAVGAALQHEHATVRAVDQEHAAAAAAQNILLAAWTLGYGAMWLTGSNAHDPAVKTALGLRAADVIVGFLYIGALREGSLSELPATPVDLAPLRIDWQQDLRP